MNINKSTVTLVMFLLVYSASASAGMSSQGVLDQVISEFSTRASGWASKIQHHAEILFFLLAPIGLVLTFMGATQSFAKLDLSDFTLPVLKYGLFGGICFWFMENGAEYAMSIINSMRMIGAEASGSGSTLSPSDVADVGFLIVHQAFANLSVWSPVDSVIGVVLSIIILLVVALIAINMMLLIISGWVLSYVGIFVLGFGALEQTRDMVFTYFKTVLGLGLELLTMILLVGIGNDLLTSFYNQMDKGQLNFEELTVMMVFSISLLVLTNKLPPLIGRLPLGGGTGGQIGAHGAGAAIAGAAMAGAAIAGAMEFLKSGAANAAGVAEAVNAASESGGGSEAGSDPGMGSILSSSNNPGGTKEDGAAALGNLFGDNNTDSQSGGAKSAFSRLTQGIKDVVAEKKDEVVSKTAGGQVASAIRAADKAATEAAAQALSETDSTDNSLSAGGNGQADEIAAFVNKSQQ